MPVDFENMLYLTDMWGKNVWGYGRKVYLRDSSFLSVEKLCNWVIWLCKSDVGKPLDAERNYGRLEQAGFGEQAYIQAS